MAIRHIAGFETADFTEFESATGSPSVQGTVKNTGSYAMECDTTGGAAVCYATESAGTSYRVTFYLRVATAPSSDVAITGILNQIHIKLTTDLYIDLYYNEDIEDTSTTQLETDRWYRICVAGESGGSREVSVYIDGNLEARETTNVLPFDGSDIGLLESVTAKIYIDDFVQDDNGSEIDLGDIRVIRGIPITDGPTHDDWKDTGGGATTYDDVDDPTGADDSDYAWVEANGTLLQQTWTSDTLSNLTGETIDSIPAIMSWFYYKTNGGGSTDEYFTYMRDNGTDYSTSIDDPKDYTWESRLDTTMPNGGAAWTEARANAYEFGMATDDASKDMWCATAYKMVAFILTTEGWEEVIGVAIDEFDGIEIAEIDGV